MIDPSSQADIRRGNLPAPFSSIRYNFSIYSYASLEYSGGISELLRLGCSRQRCWTFGRQPECIAESDAP